MRRTAKLLFLLLGVISGVTLAGAALADDHTELELAKNPFNAGRYEEAVARFRELVDPGSAKHITDPWLLERARMYLVASLIATDHVKEADAEIEVILRQNPQAVPDPIFPTQVFDRFTQVRERIRAELEQKLKERAEAERERLRKEAARKKQEQERIRELERLAGQEVRVEERSRWIGFIPFGVGQFQNDQNALGWTFLTIEAALASTTVASSIIVQSVQSQGTRPNVDVTDVNQRTRTWKQVNQLSFVALAVVAAGGVVHAQVTFVPERRIVLQRPLPPSLKLVPAASAVDRGAVIGVQGVF
jgi:hypothetical protein